MNLSADQLTDLGSLAKTYLPRIPIESFSSVANTETKTENSTNTDSAQVKKDDFANNDTQQSSTAKKDIETSAPTNSATNLTIDGEAQENSTTKNYDASLAVLGTLVTTTAKTLLPLPLAPVVDLVSTTTNTAVDLVTKPTIVTDASGNKHKKASLWDQFTGGVSSFLGLNDPKSFTSKLWNSTKEWIHPILKPFEQIYSSIWDGNSNFGFNNKTNNELIEQQRDEQRLRDLQWQEQQDLKHLEEKRRIEKEYLAKEEKERLQEKQDEEKKYLEEQEYQKNLKKKQDEAIVAGLKKIIGDLNVVVTPSDTESTVVDKALSASIGDSPERFIKLIREYKGINLDANIAKLDAAGCGGHLAALLTKVFANPSSVTADNVTRDIIREHGTKALQFNLLT